MATLVLHKPASQELEKVHLRSQNLCSILIPTLNEFENIEMLTTELTNNLAHWNYQVVFIDDSWQETGKIVSGRELAEKLVLQLPKEQSSLLVRYRPLTE